MLKHIVNASVIKAAGNKPKVIEEFIGRINSKTESVSVARMKSPGGWKETGQTPDFDEYTIVLKGILRVETRGATIDIHANEGHSCSKGRMGQIQHTSSRGI